MGIGFELRASPSKAGMRLLEPQIQSDFLIFNWLNFFRT
jgi:hypothetical protein